VEIQTDSPTCATKTIRLKQIHIEEDAGKLVHDSRTGTSLVDFNRTSVPLIEIVSEPDFGCAKEVVAYLEKLRSLLSFADISDCKMQEGSMRCDINISVRRAGDPVLGVRTEIKNMNSLKAIAAAIEYESERHINALTTGEEVLVQETRRWDDNRQQTFAMREKEDATDYRYFPNPEILPIVIDDAWINDIRQRLPETARDKYTRLTQQLGLSDYDSGIIVSGKNLAALFDQTMAYVNNPKEIANWIIVELLSIAKGDNKGAEDIKIDTQKFAALIKLVDDRTINRNVGKALLVHVLKDGIDPVVYVKEHGLGMVSDEAQIQKTVQDVLSQNAKSVTDYKNGNEKLFGFFVGQTMKALGGKADPQVVNKLIKEHLALN
jgi:aspartyl-tRNA(Asn)/glutamyl-tRNA(Gln) amidotransferase subunit B